MTIKFKSTFVLVLFLFALFTSMKAEARTGFIDEEKIENIIKNVYPSVVKVEARNRITRVATGVVIEKGGYIVTTALISPRDEDIYVYTTEGKRIEAKFLGMDSETHLALIQAKNGNLRPIATTKEKEFSPGTWIGVVSISPEDSPAITQGIISSVSKDKERIRLNVWVVQGSSGSPIVDKNGRMIGILRGSYTDESPVFFEFREKEVTGTGYVFSRAVAPSSGMAVAIPIDIVMEVASEIKEKGRVQRGWLGVNIKENEEDQVVIVGVEKDSPADKAKLREGDVVLEIDGKEVTSTWVLAKEIRKKKPGKTVSLKIERNGDVKDVKVELGEVSDEFMREELRLKFPSLFLQTPQKGLKPEFFYRGWETRKYIGVYLEEVSRELAEYFGVEEGQGLLISRINENSPADKAGLKVGDVIIRADGVRIERNEELVDLIQDKKKGDKIKIEFLRERKMKSVEVEIEEEERESFHIPRDWEAYVDSWGEFSENWKKQYKKRLDDYTKSLKNQKQNWENYYKKLTKELKEIGEKSKDATKRLIMSLDRYKEIKV